MNSDTAKIVRDWLEELGLSDSEGADALCLSHRDSIMREYKSPARDKAPSAPTLHLMETLKGIVYALILLRTGRSFDAKMKLEGLLTDAMMRRVAQMAPGPQIVSKKENGPG